MDYEVEFSPESVEDLKSIVSYIAADNPTRADSFGNQLVDRALESRIMPRKGRVVPEFGNTTIRELIEGNYRIVYRIRDTDARIDILRVWHAAQGTPKV
ncbi:MAG: type II toxin-antitoxin system RelE/ParE family toxin [Opitutales bacterium]|nr:type II toxin-antitoxin system RelE/ParE family toxin [Opitutales bacterium]